MSLIFLSYSSKDRQNVSRLAQDLKDKGFRVWMDEWNIKVGDPITQKIESGLKDCDFLAVWLTKNSVSSGWVEREWQTKYHEEVAKKKVMVLPLLAENCQLPPLLSDKKYADFRQDYYIGFSQLVKTLSSVEVLFDNLKMENAIAFMSGWLFLLIMTPDCPSRNAQIVRLESYLSDLGIILNTTLKDIFNSKDNVVNINEVIQNIGGQLISKRPEEARYFEAGYNLIFFASRNNGEAIHKIVSGLDIPAELKIPKPKLSSWINEVHDYFVRYLLAK
jgi:hypothetical protein